MHIKTEQLRVAVVDDHKLFRKGLIRLIALGDKDNRYRVVFEAENGIEMQDKLRIAQDLPDIILMDIDMPDMDGYAAVSWIRDFHPQVHILVLTMFETEDHILRMLKLGVQGYLSKDIEAEEIQTALDTISRGGFYYSEAAVGVMSKNITGGKHGISPVIEVNERMREFLKLVCSELKYTEIADRMNLSPKTIEGYRETLFERFNVKSRVALALYAVKNGIVKL